MAGRALGIVDRDCADNMALETYPIRSARSQRVMGAPSRYTVFTSTRLWDLAFNPTGRSDPGLFLSEHVKDVRMPGRLLRRCQVRISASIPEQLEVRVSFD